MLTSTRLSTTSGFALAGLLGLFAISCDGVTPQPITLPASGATSLSLSVG